MDNKMSHVATHAHELDVVEFIDTFGGIPAKTVGAVVSEKPSHALVEISLTPDMDSVLDSLVSVPYENLRILEPAPAAQHA